MDSRVNKSRKRHSGIQGPMLKKVLKTMPHCKENIPEQCVNYNSMFTNGLKIILGLYYYLCILFLIIGYLNFSIKYFFLSNIYLYN